jgi:hypothetical protein
MTDLKKWIYKYNEGGFINREHEKLEKYLMIGSIALIFVAFVSLVIWVIKDSSLPQL